jgi:Bacterial regulatory proteins, luxR family
MAIEKQLYERQLELIFRMLLENKTNEQIASELKISIRSVQNYKRKLEQRYMAYQRKKTNSTIFLEVNLLKHRLLTLYRSLENIVKDPETSGNDCAKAANIAAGIAINVIKLESEGLRAVKELAAKKNNTLLNNNLRDDDNDGRGPDTNNWQHHHQQTHQEQEENDNRKF